MVRTSVNEGRLEQTSINNTTPVPFVLFESPPWMRLRNVLTERINVAQLCDLSQNCDVCTIKIPQHHHLATLISVVFLLAKAFRSPSVLSLPPSPISCPSGIDGMKSLIPNSSLPLPARRDINDGGKSSFCVGLPVLFLQPLVEPSKYRKRGR